MRRAFFAGFCVLLSFILNAAEYPAAAQIAAAESAFAAHSVATDMREALLAAFADDSILVRAAPVPGKETIRNKPAPLIELNWRPAFVAAAASGEIGYSTGPVRITSKTNASDTPGYGQYISIWKKQQDGVWKVFIDLGISHPDPSLADTWLILSDMGTGRATETAAKNAEKAFAEIAEKAGYLESLRRFGAKDLRVFRNGHAPFIGQAALSKTTIDYAGAGQEIIKLGTSKSGDMAFALVRIAPRRADGSLDVSTAYAVRIWKATTDAKFELVLDVINESPKQ